MNRLLRAVLVGLIPWLLLSCTEKVELPPGIMVLDGRPAPALQLLDMDGQEMDLSSLRGHWVMVHFWASWCGPCRKEMPSIQRMAETLGPKHVRLILVNTAESDDTVFSFLGLVAPELPTLLDQDGQVTERWQPRGLPSSFFIGPDGGLRYLALGGRPWDSSPYLAFVQGLGQ
jgi:cytochrome c biogenesis protein CcmG, thiol:disulfide interchange protein DsbE